MSLKSSGLDEFFMSVVEGVNFVSHFCDTLKANKKATLYRWLIALILKLKFGGPCWV